MSHKKVGLNVFHIGNGCARQRMNDFCEEGVNGGFVNENSQRKRSEADDRVNAFSNFRFVLRLSKIKNFQQKRETLKDEHGAKKLKLRRQRFVVKEGVADLSG